MSPVICDILLLANLSYEQDPNQVQLNTTQADQDIQDTHDIEFDLHRMSDDGGPHA